jgi:hypothetical protein
MLGTTLPTPLYVIYQAQWHFPTSLITLIFATYAVGVLAALLAAGRSSDQVGRRPVLAAAIGLSIASAVTFILAPGTGWLFAGRMLSGLSAGLMTGTATAALTETAPPGSGHRASLVSTTANSALSLRFRGFGIPQAGRASPCRQRAGRPAWSLAKPCLKEMTRPRLAPTRLMSAQITRWLRPFIRARGKLISRPELGGGAPCRSPVSRRHQ